MNPYTLSYKTLFRPGSSSKGELLTERGSVDFLINGRSLLGMLVVAAGGHSDFMGSVVDGADQQNRDVIARLNLDLAPDTERGGTLIYICPQCGDIGCGAYSVIVARCEGGYEWRDFAYENGYEEPRLLEGVGPFEFSGEAYASALAGLAIYGVQKPIRKKSGKSKNA